VINSGNIKMLFMISKPKFMEPEVGVVIKLLVLVLVLVIVLVLVLVIVFSNLR